MKQSTLYLMTAAVVIGVLALLVINFYPVSVPDVTSSGPPPAEVRGMSVFHKGIPYTLNFEQQSLANDALFHAVEVKKADYKPVKEGFPFEKIVVYRFNAPDVEIFPIQYVEGNLVFSSPMLNNNAYYMELSGGAFTKMITNSYDPEKK